MAKQISVADAKIVCKFIYRRAKNRKDILKAVKREYEKGAPQAMLMVELLGLSEDELYSLASDESQ